MSIPHFPAGFKREMRFWKLREGEFERCSRSCAAKMAAPHAVATSCDTPGIFWKGEGLAAFQEGHATCDMRRARATSRLFDLRVACRMSVAPVACRMSHVGSDRRTSDPFALRQSVDVSSGLGASAPSRWRLSMRRVRRPRPTVATSCDPPATARPEAAPYQRSQQAATLPL